MIGSSHKIQLQMYICWHAGERTNSMHCGRRHLFIGNGWPVSSAKKLGVLQTGSGGMVCNFLDFQRFISIQTHQHLYIPGNGHSWQRPAHSILLSESGRIVSKCLPKVTALQPVIEPSLNWVTELSCLVMKLKRLLCGDLMESCKCSNIKLK